MPITSTGAVRPGGASGTHSGYFIGEPRTSSHMSRLWGWLKRQQRLKEAMAEAQIEMMRQQARAAARPAPMSTQERIQWEMWQKAKNALNLGSTMPGSAPLAIQDFSTQSANRNLAANLLTALGAQGGSGGFSSVGGSTQGQPSGAYDRQMAMALARGTGGVAKTLPVSEEPAGGDMFPNYGPPSYSIPGIGPTLGQQTGLPASVGGLGLKRGTLPGTVGEKGGRVHEGEVVVPKEQVTPNLVHALTMDALRKGVPLGQKAGGGFQEGSLGEDPLAELFRMMEESRGTTQEALQQWGERYGYRRGRGQGGRFLPSKGVPAVLPPRGAGSLPAPTTRGGFNVQETWEHPWLSGPGPGEPGVHQPGLGVAQGNRARALREALKDLNPEEARLLEEGARNLLGEGRTITGYPPGMMDATPITPRLKQEGVEAAVERLAKAPGGRKVLKRLGKYGAALGIGAAALAAISQYEKPSKEKEDEDVSFWEAAQRTPGNIIEGITDIPAHVANAYRKLMEAPETLSTEPGLQPPTSMTTPVALNPEPIDIELPASPKEAPPQAPEGTLEAALARTGEGDFGTPESPLTLQRQEPLSDYERGMDIIRGLPEQVTAKHKAGMAQVEAEKMLDTLMYHGHRLDPERKAMLQQMAREKMGIASMYDKEAKAREQFLQRQLQAGAELEMALAKIQAKEGAMGERQLNVEQAKQQNRMQLALLRESAQSLRQLEVAARLSTSGRARAEAKASIAGLMQRIASLSRGMQMSDEDALQAVEVLISLPDEEREKVIAELQQEAMRSLGRR